MLTPSTRPVRRVQKQVGVLSIATPHREAQVVANQRPHSPTLELELHLTFAGGVVIVLAGHAEQVTLVVVQDFAIRPRPQQAIAMTAVGGLNDHATSDYRIQLRRLSPQPFTGGAVFRLG
ncbi:hypothetical protein D3C71_679440 [compost metagenome]